MGWAWLLRIYQRYAYCGIAEKIMGLLAGIMFVGGALVAAIGFVDDIFRVSISWRLLVYFIAVLSAVYFLGGLSSIWLANYFVDLRVAGDIF